MWDMDGYRRPSYSKSMSGGHACKYKQRANHLCSRATLALQPEFDKSSFHLIRKRRKRIQQKNEHFFEER
jgi:hypothetical protein